MLFQRLALSLPICLLCFRHAMAQQAVDVYFITGQSNAVRFAGQSGTGADNLGFTMHHARSADLFNDFPNHTTVTREFSSSSVNGSLATSVLAAELRQPGRDVAIFTFARSGAGLHRNLPGEGGAGNDWIWYPGSDPAAGQLYQESMYANSVTWFNSRLAELEAAGLQPEVKGLFWFQGEKDARMGGLTASQGGMNDHNLYAGNFDNLVYRFRQDFGADLPIVSAQIREFSTDPAATQNVINAALAQAAVDDPRIGSVTTEGLAFGSSTDVHVTNAGHAVLASRWSAEMQSVQSFLLGDCNQDGVVDFNDISFFVTILLDGDYLAEADTNGDSVISFDDIPPFVAILLQ